MSTPDPTPPVAAAPAPAPATAKPAKRWKKPLLISGCVVGGLFLFVLIAGPFIIGAIAKSRIASVLAEKLQAAVTIGGVSFGWSGHVEIDDVRIVPAGFADPLVEVKKVDLRVALGSAIGGRYIADVDVVAPKILVEKGTDGKFNYEFPPSREPKPRKPEGKESDEAPFVQANVRIRDGELRIRGRGRETQYRNLTAEAKVDTLEKPIPYAVSFESPGKDTARLSGSIDLRSRSGVATLILDRFSLWNLSGVARAYSDVVELDGTVSGTLDYQIQGAPRFAGKGRLEIRDFSAVLQGRTVTLDRLTFTHDGGIDEKGSGRHLLTMASGKALDVRVQVDVTDALGLAPAVKADMTGTSDLGDLGRLLANVIGLKRDTAIEGAAILKGTVEAKGSETATVRVDVAVSNLVAIEGKERKKVEIDRSIELQLAGGWDGKTKTATADLLSLKSSFATVDGKGGASLARETPEIKESTFRLQADLEKLGAKLALFMENAPGLRGTVTTNASYAGDRYTLDAALDGVSIRNDKTVTGPIDATVSQKGVFSLKNGGAFKIETGVVTSSAADLRLSGEIRKVLEESREGEIRVEAVARPVELSRWVPDLNLGGPAIALTSVVSIQAKRVTIAGQTQLSGLTMPGKTAKTGVVEFKVAMGDPDIVATLKAPTFEWTEKGYAAKGGLEAQVTYSEKQTTGTTRLTDLEIADDKKNVVKNPGMTIVHDVDFVDKNKSVHLKKVEVASTFLRGTVQGRILRLEPALEFQELRVDFKYHPDKLGAVLKPWLPGKLEGAEEKSFEMTLDGKAASTAVLALLRGTKSGIELDLARFTTDGLTVSGKTHLELQDGKLVSTTPLSVNKGRADLSLALDFNPAEKKPQSSLVLDAKEVDANGQMGPILQRINPIFHTNGVDAKIDGQIRSDVQLLWTGPIDPDEKDWTAAAARSLSGGGVFGVKNLNILGSPTVAQIMAALGQDNALQGELIATQIRIANGRCEYENMILRGSRKDAASLKRDEEQLAADRRQLEADAPQLNAREVQKRQEELRQREEDLPFRYTLRFTGWIGFDKKMQLRVLMPMTPHMAKSHPGLTKYIGTSFWVDLAGSADSPRLDLGKMLAEAARRAAENVLMDKLDDALKRLLDRKKKDEKK